MKVRGCVLLMLLMLTPVTSAAGVGIINLPLNKDTWLEQCSVVRELQMTLYAVAQLPEHVSIAKIGNATAGGLKIKGAVFPIPSIRGRLFTLDEAANSVSLSFVSDEGYSLIYESSERVYMSDFWAIDGAAKEVTGYEVTDTAQLTSWLFHGPLSMDELRLEGVTTNPDRIACSESSLARDLRGFLALMVRDADADRVYVVESDSLRGTAELFNEGESRRITFRLFDKSRSYMLSYRFPAADEAFLAKILSVLRGESAE